MMTVMWVRRCVTGLRRAPRPTRHFMADGLRLVVWSALIHGGITGIRAAEYRTVNAIPYRSHAAEGDDRCRLDLHHPVGTPGFATVVWFHGGGLTTGHRELPKGLRNQGFAVAGVGYRLSPDADTASILDDAAAAVAWVFDSIERYGGDRRRIIVSGHSAGGYLAAMVGLDKKLLATHGVDANDLAGIAPYSGHSITHFRIRAERGIPGHQPVIDEYAPLFHVRRDAPPILLITGDREREMLGRYEETAYFWRMLKVAGHPDARLVELKDQDHNGMLEPAHALLIQFVTEGSHSAPHPLPETRP